MKVKDHDIDAREAHVALHVELERVEPSGGSIELLECSVSEDEAADEEESVGREDVEHGTEEEARLDLKKK